MDWVNPKVIKDAPILAESCASAKPFPHVFIKNFLVKPHYDQLKNALRSEEFIPRSSDLFEFNQTVDLRSCEQPLLRELQKMLSTKEMHSLIKRITGVSTRGQADGFGSHYTDTHYLLSHDDRLERRKVAYILYLSTLKDSDGGELDLFASGKKNNPGKIVKSYLPQENALVLFPVTKCSWHQVREVITDVDRLAIGGWFYG